jgi:ATP-binding cassette subfamily F protein uup
MSRIPHQPSLKRASVPAPTSPIAAVGAPAPARRLHLPPQARAARLEAQEAADAADRNTLRREAAWARKQPKARESKSKARLQAYDNLANRVAAAPRDAGSLDIASKGMSRLGTSVATFESVSVRFGEGYVIRDFSYDFSRGDRIGVVGPNGAGKSTFLKALQGMLPLYAGTVKVRLGAA